MEVPPIAYTFTETDEDSSSSSSSRNTYAPFTEDFASCHIIGDPPTYLIWRIHKSSPNALEVMELTACNEVPRIGLRLIFPDALSPFAFICNDETSNSIRKPYLLYTLTASGVAYLFKLRSVSEYVSCSIVSQNEVIEFNLRTLSQSAPITAVTATGGCLVIARRDASVSCFQLGVLNTSAQGYMHELRDDFGIGRLWGLMERGRTVAPVQDIVIAGLHGRKLIFVVHVDESLRMWDLLSHTKLLSHTICTATSAGNQNPSVLVDFLVQTNLYDLAFTVLLKFWKGSELKRELERVFAALALLKCCPNSAVPSTGIHSLLLTASEEESCSNIAMEISPSVHQSKGNSQWETLEQYLGMYMKLHPRLPVIVAENLLRTDPQMELPLWLVLMFKDGHRATSWGMTGVLEANPGSLFSLYIDNGRFTEATNLLFEYKESYASLKPADIMNQKKMLAIWFPYTAIERLWCQLEETKSFGRIIDQCDQLKRILHGALHSLPKSIEVDDAVSSDKDKINEDLRLEDEQLGVEGGPAVVSLGTIVIASKCQGGLVFGADSRRTETRDDGKVRGYDDDTAKKIQTISHRIFVLMAGDQNRMKKLIATIKTMVEENPDIWSDDICTEMALELSGKSHNSSFIICGQEPNDSYFIKEVQENGVSTEKDFSICGSGAMPLVEEVLTARNAPNFNMAAAQRAILVAILTSIVHVETCGGWVHLFTLGQNIGHSIHKKDEDVPLWWFLDEYIREPIHELSHYPGFHQFSDRWLFVNWPQPTLL